MRAVRKTSSMVYVRNAQANHATTCPRGNTTNATSNATPPKSITNGCAGKINKLVSNVTNEKRRKVATIMGIVVICAARVTMSASLSQPRNHSARCGGINRKSSRRKICVRGSVKKSNPAVAARLSWKPTSHSTKGLCADMSSAASASEVGPWMGRSSRRARIARLPITAARTTAAEAPTRNV